jgi:phage-related protein
MKHYNHLPAVISKPLMIMERSTKCFCSGPKQRKKIRTRISEIRTQMRHSVKKNCVTIMKAVKQIKIISDKEHITSAC